MYQLRPAVGNDLSFVLRAHHSTLREYIEPISGWDQSFWDDAISSWFQPERVQIVERSGASIGVLVVQRKMDHYFFESISLLPEFQNQGIGSQLIRNILSEAKEENLPVRLNVLTTNLPAQRLYKKFGFEVSLADERDFHMIWKP